MKRLLLETMKEQRESSASAVRQGQEADFPGSSPPGEPEVPKSFIAKQILLKTSHLKKKKPHTDGGPEAEDTSCFSLTGTS